MSTLGDRDDAILKHLQRYHLTTSDVLRRKFFPDTNDAAVRKVIARLIRERRMRGFDLFDNRKYYVLTAREAVARNEHRSISREFNYQGFVNAYAVLCFCAAHGVDIYTPNEFEADFPDLIMRGVGSRNYYVERSEEPNRLAFILVDYGTNPERIAKKVGHIIARGYTLPPFTRLIQRGRFVITVLTADEDKRSFIRAAIEADPAQFVKVRLEVVPELRDILVNRGRIRPAAPRTGDTAGEE